MSNNKISIITVVYNGENGIERTIKSVINQTYLDKEYIIIDGESQDKTIQICNQYKTNISRIISEPDEGIYNAMNKGIQLASGAFIIFMNCGDYFAANDVLEKVTNAVKKLKYKSMFVYGDSFEKNDDGKLFLKSARNIKYRITGMFAHHQAIFYNLKIIKKNKLKYDTKYKIAADYDFTLKYLEYITYQNTEKLGFPICIFSLGGESSQKAYLGFKEQFLIKIKYFNIFVVLIASLFQYFLILVRKYFPSIYKLYRYE